MAKTTASRKTRTTKKVEQKPTAQLYAFPVHRDVQIINKLVRAYRALGYEYGRGADTVFKHDHMARVKRHLLKYGMNTVQADMELHRINKAMGRMFYENRAQYEREEYERLRNR